MKIVTKTMLNLFVIIGLFSILSAGCSKKEDINPDFASIIVGTYNGTITMSGIGTTPGSTTISRVSDTRVNLTLVISGTSIPMNGITVSSPSKNNYNLYYGVTGESISGLVAGNTLNWTLTSGTSVGVFTGTR